MTLHTLLLVSWSTTNNAVGAATDVRHATSTSMPDDLRQVKRATAMQICNALPQHLPHPIAVPFAVPTLVSGTATPIITVRTASGEGDFRHKPFLPSKQHFLKTGNLNKGQLRKSILTVNRNCYRPFCILGMSVLFAQNAHFVVQICYFRSQTVVFVSGAL